MISLSLTATTADFANSVEFGSNYNAIPDVVDVSLSAEPSEAAEASFHEWVLVNARIEETVTEIILEYPDTTSFDGVDSDDVTVRFERPNGQLREVDIEDDEFSGTDATFIVDDNQSELVNRAEIDIDGIQNPEPGSYSPDITFLTEEGNSYTANSGELNIASEDAFFSVEIDSAPDVVEKGDDADVDYTVENLDDDIGSQDIELRLGGENGEVVDVDEEVTLEGGESESGTLSYGTTDDDIPTIELAVTSEQTSDEREVRISGWRLELDPSDQNSDSTHTWTNALVDLDGEIEEIELDYSNPGNQSYDFGDVGEDEDEEGFIVEIERDGDDDPEEIDVVNGPFNGEIATLELDDSRDTEPAGTVRVIIDDLENPSPGDYEATITLTTDVDETSETIEFEVG